MEYPTSKTFFLSNKLLLPLFLTSRNRIRITRFHEIRDYIARHAKAYASCIEGKLEDEEEVRIVDATGGGKQDQINSLRRRPKQKTGKCAKVSTTRQEITQEIGAKKKGMKGAYWSRTKRVPMGVNTKNRCATAFYELPRESEKFQKRCHHFKGKFLTDPRKRRPSTRFMTSNIFTCWRNPKDPGPTQYTISISNRKIFEKIKSKPLLPFKFLRYSCVPEKKNAAHAKKTSFDPGPGRYELFDDEDAFQLELRIADQKRLKFRRLSYKHIKGKRRAGSHLWRHVFGFGFTRLFRGPILYPAVIVSKKKEKGRKVEKEVTMFANSEYIKMITCPIRTTLSLRKGPVKRKYKPIHYNCIVKVIVRRQLRNNKKIAFNSGTPRFPDSDMPTGRKMAKPPPLVDHPVMRVPASKIQSQLHAIPYRLKGIVKENRIRPFKFQPFPSIKLLLDDTELHPESLGSAELHPRELIPKDFFKDEFKKK